MNLDAVIAELEYFQEGVFPRKALQEAIAHPVEITPVLLKTLEDAKNNIQRLVDDIDYMLPIYALYLLAQFREPKAYPLIIDFFSIPGNAPVDVTGDFVSEDLGRVLASVCDGNVEPIKQLVETPGLNEMVNGAGLTAFKTLLAEKKIDRELVVDYFKHLFATLDRNSENVWTSLVISSLEIYPDEEILDLVQATFDDGLVGQWWVGPNDVKYFQNLGLKHCLIELAEQKHNRFVQDTIAEIEWWPCFQKQGMFASPQPTVPQSVPPTQSEPSQSGSSQAKSRAEEQQPVKQLEWKPKKSKKSPLQEARGFSSVSSKKKASKKKKRSKK
ncbi:MAG: DUF1186 domain-containing protein [Cyanobacteria bacterium P01_F01_bin.150]